MKEKKYRVHLLEMRKVTADFRLVYNQCTKIIF